MMKVPSPGNIITLKRENNAQYRHNKNVPNISHVAGLLGIGHWLGLVKEIVRSEEESKTDEISAGYTTSDTAVGIHA